jgi:SNF2 family DNA or RNA helicase
MADMDGAADASAPDSIQDEIENLREDINLNVGLLASLDDENDSESEETKEVIARNLKRFRKRLRVLEQSLRGPSQPNGAAESSTRVKPESGGPSQTLMSPSTFDLVTRKRQRGDFDDDDNASRGSKSRKQSPYPSTGPTSPAAESSATHSEDDAHNPLRSLFQDDEEADYTRYLKDLETRKKQEDEDAALARRLQDEMDAEAASAPAPAPTAAQRQPSMTSSQSFFRSDGSLRQSSQSNSGAQAVSFPPPPSQYASAPTRSDDVFNARDPSRPGPLNGMAIVDPVIRRTLPRPESVVDLSRSPALSPASSTDSLQEIPADRASVGMLPHHSLPGSYPGSSNYVNLAGTSVYNNHGFAGGKHGYGLGNLNGSYSIPGTGLTAPRAMPYGVLPANNNLDMLRSLNGFYDDTADPAKTQEEIKDLLKHIRPDEKYTEAQLAEMPEGLTYPLMPHQINGLTWMKSMEEGTNKGGILADDMGLGKTLQAISLILARPPPENDPRPTLIVAPLALMFQWKRELEKFVRPGKRFNVCLLHGPGRPANYQGIRNYDVVITTYGLLAAELNKAIVNDDKRKRAADPSTIKDNCPILGPRAKFHRVILDEAQNIKNRAAKASQAACRITATHRWCLSGTPMQNNVEEMYSLIRFCGIRPYNNWDRFSRDISRPLKGRGEAGKERAMTTLQALLKALLLRRTKTSKINGQPIIQLPDKNIVEERVVFGKDQEDFYRAMESKAQIQFNRYLRSNGSIGQNYSQALVLLLRLRQACCHPALVTNSKDFEQIVGELGGDELIENAKQLDGKVVERLKSESNENGLECPVCMDAAMNATIFPCGHNVCTECFTKLCDTARNNEEGSSATCPHCRAKIDASKTTDLESFRRVYDPEHAEGDSVAFDTDDDSDTELSDDDDDGADLRDFIVADDDDLEYEDGEGKSKGHKKTKSDRKGKGKAKKEKKALSLAQLRKEGLRSKSAKAKYLRRLAKDFVSSAKIDKTIAILEEIHARGENEKTIVFSNFTSFLDLLEVPLSRHATLSTYGRYDGSMSSSARNDAVLDFTEKSNNRIILVSLKAGNAGLNLTAANHCIMLDPFWNPFVEYQAADRCYRIGQMREVTVHRVLIGDSEGGAPVEGQELTVEDRILRLQEKKKDLVETALDERAGDRIQRLGVRELGYLFGVNNLN